MILFKCVSRRVVCGAVFFFASSSALIGQAAPSTSTTDQLKQSRKQEAAWFLKGRATPSGQSSAVNSGTSVKLARQSTLKAQTTLRSGTPADSYLGTQWTPLGPAPTISAASGADQDYGFVSGRATAIAVDQDDLSGNTLYVGGATGGLWRSTNAAATDVTQITWQPLIDNQATLSVGSVAIQPGHTGVILVGTGEPNSSVDSYYGLGILRSTDSGAHWSLISAGDNGASPFHGLAFAKIAFSADNPNLVVAAAASSSEGLSVGAETPNYAAQRGLYYSTDAGLSWHIASVIDSGASSPSNPSATTVLYHSAQHKFYAALRFHGFYSSSDGANWTRLPNQPPSTTYDLSLANCPTQPAALPDNCPLYRSDIAQVPGRDEMYVWFVDAQDTPSDEGIYLTRDGGNSWITLNTTGIANCGDMEGCETEDGAYALTLAAVPNGSTATDLYAGSTNVYRCRLDPVANPTCSATNNGFVNLTHVYGCSPVGSYSHMHPEQHGIAFSQANSATVYFANDGGVYRSTSNFGTTMTGQCGTTPYSVDNLNGTLGSMAQLVSLSADASDPSTLFASATGSGLSATSSAINGANGTTWLTVENGSYGMTAMDLSGWFASISGVFNIQRCTKGISCTPADWQFVLDQSQVQGDATGFHFPFLLDPQNASRIIAGTCRVWRGSRSGNWSSSSALSGKLDGSAGSTACSNDSTGFIRSLAAGGTSTGAGSQVIYAGTEDGRIWVTTDAASGPSSWHETSPVSGGFQDPACGSGVYCPYPVSGIALDPSDATGQIAYAVVLGFGVGHIWQTTSGGAAWIDISTNMPDVPANAVVVDPTSGLVYIGTDQGVFAAQPNGDSTLWSEVGPASGTGALPNAPVTQVNLFHPTNQPSRLRAATYGRGVWEMPLPGSSFPDFSIQVTSASLSAYPSATTPFQGILTSINGYANPVSLSCYAAGAALPQQCGNNNNFLPTSGGTSFAVPVSNPGVGDFSFQIQAQDASGLVHGQAVSLHVMDFSIAAPTPASVTMSPVGNSTINVLASSLGSFSQRITLTCPAAASGISCAGSSSTLSAGSSQTIPVTISVSSGVAIGNYTTTLVAVSADGLQTKTASVGVQVQSATQDFWLQVTNQSLASAKPGQIAKTTLTISSLNGFSGTVNLSCASPQSPPTCSISPATVSTFPAQATVQIDTTGVSPANLNLVITGSTAGSNTHTLSLTLPVVSFELGTVTPPQPATGGATANFSIQLVSQNGYTGAVQTSCDATALSQNQTCTLSPNNPTLTANSTTTVQGQVPIPQGQAPGSYQIKFSAVDASYAALGSSQNMTLTVQGAPTFQIAVTPAASTVNAGQTASNINVTITPQAGFTGSVNLSCASLPSASTCTFNLATVSVNGTPVQALMQISTTAVSTAHVHPGPRELKYLVFALGLPLGLIQLASPAGGLRKRRKGVVCGLVLLVGLATAMIACGGSGSASSSPPIQPTPGTPSGTFTVVVSGNSGNIIQTANFTLTVN
jgi:large repetitive protein